MSLVKKRGLSYRELTDKQKKEYEDQDKINEIYDFVMRGGKVKTNEAFERKYEPEMIKTMLQHMAVEGKSYKSLAYRLGVDIKTLYQWEKDHAEWKEAKKIAFQGRLGRVEEMLTKLGEGETKGNAAAAIFYAKNACPDEFKDKREIGHQVQGTVYVIDTGIPSKNQVEGKNKPQLPDSKIIESDFEEIEQDNKLL